MTAKNAVEPKKNIEIDIESQQPGQTSIQPEIKLTWSDLCFSVPIKGKEQKKILNGISGHVSPGEVVAIMGSSGSGKTTLLNVLAGRVGKGELNGSVLVNGRPRDYATWKSTVAYVEQDDLMYQNLTVQETLTFSALLRLPSSVTREEKMKKVEKIIKNLGLSNCKNTIIGDSEKRGISGGERKRVSIGMEMVTDPRLLFLDEPTSGLDAFTAAYIIETVKKMAKIEKTAVLLTIHQPREYILTMFDRIILLSGGKTVFTGSVKDAIQHFDNNGFICPPNTNPSDFFLDVMTIDYRSDELKEQSLAKVKKLQDSWPGGEVSTSIRNSVNATGDFADQMKNSALVEFLILLKRDMMEVLRDKPTIFATIGQAIVNLILIGFIFFQLDTEAEGIQNRIGVLFMTTIQTTFGNVMPTIAVFTLQRAIVKKERAAGTYRAITAFSSKIVAQWPFIIFGTLLFAFPVYKMIALQNETDLYLKFVLILALHASISLSLGIMISSGAPNVRVGQILGPTIVVIFLIFGGPLVNLDKVSESIKWIKWLSIIKYTFSSLSINEFTNLKFNCPPVPNGCVEYGEKILEQYNLDDLPLWTNIGINSAIGVGFLILGFILFYYKSKPLLRLQ